MVTDINNYTDVDISNYCLFDSVAAAPKIRSIRCSLTPKKKNTNNHAAEYIFILNTACGS